MNINERMLRGFFVIGVLPDINEYQWIVGKNSYRSRPQSLLTMEEAMEDLIDRLLLHIPHANEVT